MPLNQKYLAAFQHSASVDAYFESGSRPAPLLPAVVESSIFGVAYVPYV